MGNKMENIVEFKEHVQKNLYLPHLFEGNYWNLNPKSPDPNQSFDYQTISLKLNNALFEHQ